MRPGGGGERILVDFFYAQPVGHVIEALHHCLALYRADPRREISLLLNAAAPTELAELCPFVRTTYAIDAPFVEAAPDAERSLRDVPRAWHRVLDDPRRHQPIQLELFPGMRDHYAASDRRFISRLPRRPLGHPPPSRARHQQLRLLMPETARQAAAGRLAGNGGPTLALTPAGSGPRSHYPSVGSWELILDALARALPDLRVLLVGRSRRDARTSSSLTTAERRRLLAHAVAPVDLFDVPLFEQLAAVQAADVFLSPHTGFGMAALAVGTPWLAISGGRWFEWYFNRVPFRSIIPDTSRYPCFTQFAADTPAPDGDDGDRIPSMTRARIHEDLDRVIAAAHALIHGTLPYARSLDDYVADLLDAHNGDASPLWSFDDVHLDHLPERGAPRSAEAHPRRRTRRSDMRQVLTTDPTQVSR